MELRETDRKSGIGQLGKDNNYLDGDKDREIGGLRLTNRQTDRQTDRQTHTHREREREREREGDI